MKDPVKHRATMRRIYAARKAAGQCPKCGADVQEFVHCLGCRTDNAALKRARRRMSPDVVDSAEVAA
jgi:hypothetical protein